MENNTPNTKPKTRTNNDVEQFNATASQVLDAINSVIGIAAYIDSMFAKLEVMVDEAKQLLIGAKTQIDQAKNAAIQEIMNRISSVSIPLHLQPHQQADAIAAGDGRTSNRSNQPTVEITP